jgi:hypothetical protein
MGARDANNGPSACDCATSVAITAFGSPPPPASARNNPRTHSLCAGTGAARDVLLTIRRIFNMKATTLVVVSALATGFFSVSAASAAPASGAVISSAASSDSVKQNVWYRGWGWRGWGWRPWAWRAWGPSWGYHRPWGPGWCYYHPYQCGRW